jgi:AbrB family looped-hinge helix DNA binding protein
MKTTVDRFGRIVVPKEIRDRHGLVPGSEIDIEDAADMIVVRRRAESPGLVEKEGILVFRGQATGDLNAAVKSHRNDRLRKARGWSA